MNEIIKLTSIRPEMGLIFATFAAGFSEIFAAHWQIMKFLLILMVADYFTGCVIAIILKKSPKTENGKYASWAGLIGLFRKGGILLVLYISTQLDTVLGFDYITLMAIWFFMLNELYSLKENLILMGVKIPPAWNDAIDMIRKKSGQEDRPPDPDGQDQKNVLNKLP